MANRKHLDILKQGVVIWNQWRREHPNIQIDLSQTNLRNIITESFSSSQREIICLDLSEANLAETDLSGMDLQIAVLDNANLQGANLSNAHLFETSFSDADLRFATRKMRP